MKKFFRERKLSIDSKSKPVLPPAAPASTHPDSESTPLYARFASLHRNHDHGGASKPTVSGPMQLSSKPSLSRTSLNGGVVSSTPAKSKGSEKQSKGVSRMPSSSQDSSMLRFLHRKSSRTSQDEARPQVLDRMSNGKEEPKLQVAASPQEPSPATRADPRLSPPHKQPQVYAHNGISPQGLMVPRMEWTPSQSTSSLTSASDSISYSPLPKQLVVRNFDPENDSLASSIARPAHLSDQHYHHTQPASSPPVPPKPLEVISPFARPSPLSPDSQSRPFPLPQDTRYHNSSRTTSRHTHTNGQNVNGPHHHASLHTSNTPSSPSYSQFPQSALSPPSPTRPLPSRPQDSQRHDPDNALSGAPPVRKVSLLSTPSVSRRKYSPLAAFGLPLSQANSSASQTTDTSSTSASAYNEKPPTDVHHGWTPPAPAATPGTREPPSLPRLDVSSTSFEHAPLDIDFSNWRKTATATEATSKRTSRADSPTKRSSTIPSIPPSPASLSQSQLPEIDEQEFAMNEIPNNDTITASHPKPSLDPPMKAPLEPKPAYTAPVPVHPSIEPGTVASRLSASLHSNSTAYQAPAPPSYSPADLSTPDTTNVGGDTWPQKGEEPLPAPPARSRSGHAQQGQYANKMLARGLEVPDPNARYTPPDQQNGPIQGRPLIFAAMEATETSDAQDLRVDPRMIGFIGNVSAAMKTEEVHDFVQRQTGYQTPTSTPPPPPPEKEEKPHRKKLSKVRRDQSSRRVEDEPRRESPTKLGSARTTILRSPDDRDTRSAPRSSIAAAKTVSAPVSPTPKSSSPLRTREEIERPASDAGRQARKRSSHTENKLHRRSRDVVKMLTEKQAEKLSNRKSYNGSPTKLPEPPVSPSKRSTPAEQSSAYPPPPHKLSYRSTAPYIPTQPAEPPVTPPPAAKRAHHNGHLSLSNGIGSRHTSAQLPTPPEEYQPSAPPRPRRERKSASPPVHHHHHHEQPGESREPPPEPRFYPLVAHLADPVLLEELLCYLTYYDWLTLAFVSKEVRLTMYEKGREQILERYLRTVGYARWSWASQEPLELRVQDLCHYMRGVSIPSHQFAATANNHLQNSSSVDPMLMEELTFSCRAFTRVVLRLRAQAEAEAMFTARSNGTPSYPTNLHPRSRTYSNSAVPHRTPSKWSSQTSINMSRASSRAPSPAPSSRYNASAARGPFQSPLFRLRRAPLLQVFVPSPEGDWLSDASILECEAELRRAGVLHLMRAGDVVWDVAVGDEANIGRLVWDGNYLIDLDYTYSRVGDAPRYLPTLAFPPSYFHRVIRTMGTGNPIVRIDLSPWADQIDANLQLIQDRMRTDTPQGGRHMVVRWVHRSSFVIRPSPGSKSIRLNMPSTAGPGPSPTGAWIVDPGWYGTVIVETEGTNEGLADLRARCKGPLHQRGPVTPEYAQWEEKRVVFRILRERSRPGEICIRAVDDKERIIPL